MGKTSFSGPVYGAKSLLWTYGPYTQTGFLGRLHRARDGECRPAGAGV
jgi:hypothetical protein